MSEQSVLGWQGGWDEPGVLLLLLIASSIPGSGLFVYTGTPAANDLFASIAATSGNDIYGNPYVEGVVVYEPLSASYIQIHVNNSLTAPAIELVTGAGSEAEHASIYSVVVHPFAVNEIIEQNFLGPGSTHDNTQSLIQQVSAAKNGSTLAGGVIYMGVSGSFTPVAFWNVNGLATSSPGGSSWQVNGTQTDTSHITVTSASATAITVNWSIPANDAKVGTTYKVRAYGLGTQGSTQQNLFIDGNTGNPTIQVAGTIIGISQAFSWEAECEMRITATGVSGTADLKTKFTWQAAAVGSTTNTWSGVQVTNGTAINTTIAQTTQIRMHWNSTTGAPTISGEGSVFTREGT